MEIWKWGKPHRCDTSSFICFHNPHAGWRNDTQWKSGTYWCFQSVFTSFCLKMYAQMLWPHYSLICKHTASHRQIYHSHCSRSTPSSTFQETETRNPFTVVWSLSRATQIFSFPPLKPLAIPLQVCNNFVKKTVSLTHWHRWKRPWLAWPSMAEQRLNKLNHYKCIHNWSWASIQGVLFTQRNCR